jgi:hypothetical protein
MNVMRSIESQQSDVSIISRKNALTRYPIIQPTLQHNVHNMHDVRNVRNACEESFARAVDDSMVCIIGAALGEGALK